MTRFAGGPTDSPGFLLWHVTLRWQRAMAQALAPLGLTHVQFVLLACAWWLNEHAAPPNQLALARQAGTDVKMTSEVVRRLEARCLIERTTDPGDARAKVIRLTPQGLQSVALAIAAVEDADEAFFAPVADGAQLTVLLRRLAAVPPYGEAKV